MMTPKEFLKSDKIKYNYTDGFTEKEWKAIRNWMNEYAEYKLKATNEPATEVNTSKANLTIPVVTLNEVAVCDCLINDKKNIINGVYCKKHKTFFAME